MVDPLITMMPVKKSGWISGHLHYFAGCWGSTIVSQLNSHIDWYYKCTTSICFPFLQSSNNLLHLKINHCIEKRSKMTPKSENTFSAER